VTPHKERGAARREVDVRPLPLERLAHVELGGLRYIFIEDGMRRALLGRQGRA